jgi:hypothetical protein
LASIAPFAYQMQSFEKQFTLKEAGLLLRREPHDESRITKLADFTLIHVQDWPLDLCNS